MKPAVIAGSPGLMCSLARDILAACGQRQPGAAAAPAKAHGNVNQGVRAKCQQIADALAIDSSRGRQKKLCAEQGIDPAVFIRWRNQHQHAGLSSADNPRA